MSFTKKPGGAYLTNIGLCLTKQSEVRNSNFVIGLTWPWWEPAYHATEVPPRWP